jgi:uncharacterized alpha-E superfamily protein
MTHSNNSNSTLNEIRAARDHAEFLRDQLLAQWQHLKEDEQEMTPDPIQATRREKGKDAMQKAITAANHAIASINQALSDLERVK